MPALVEEIMNRELFSVRPHEPCANVLGYILSLGISGAPVLDDDGKPTGMVSFRDLIACDENEPVSARMTSPVVTVPHKATIEQAARLMAETDYHRLVAVDEAGRAVGVVSALDAVRGLVGLPARHPSMFPHYDPSLGVEWSDDVVLEFDHVEAAPEAPGVLVLIHGGRGERERQVWAESTRNLRGRLIEVLSAPGEQPPGLAWWLEQGDLRFRTAVVRDESRRREALAALRTAI